MHRPATYVGLSLTLLLAPAVGLAQEDPNLKMWKRLFSKLTQTLNISTKGSPDLDGATPGQTFLVILNPGIFVDPTIDPESRTGRQALADLANMLPRPTWLFDEATERLSEVYERVLEDSEYVQQEQNAGQKKALAEARAFLYDTTGANPSPILERYWDLQGKYLAAVAACEKDRSQKPQCAAELKNAKDQAKKQWETLGKKNDVEKQLQAEHQLTSTMANWWFDMRQRFDNAKETGDDGSEFYRVQVYPSYKAWFADSGWTSYKVVDSELEQQKESTRTSFSGSGGSGWGLFSFRANYNKQTKEERYQSKVKDITISMEVKRVRINRPWLSGVLLKNTWWRFDKTKVDPAKVQLSDGKGSATTAPTGLMPLVPTGFLLSRKVSLSGLDEEELKTYFESHEGGGGNVGWGPWSVGGNYNRDETREYRKAKRVANGLESPDPQIIGVYCDVLGTTPNPDPNPNLKWLSASAPAPPQ